MTDDKRAAIERATRVLCAANGVQDGDVIERQYREDAEALAAAGLLAAPAPAVDLEGLANFVANAISRSSQQHVPVGYRVADALIAAGQVGGTDAQQRVDAALAVLADRHEDWCPGKIHANCCGLDCECGYGEIRDALIARKHPMPDRPFGAVHWPASSYTEVVAQRNEANARIDAALALLDPAEIHHIAGPLADRLRRVLTGQDGDTDG